MARTPLGLPTVAGPTQAQTAAQPQAAQARPGSDTLVDTYGRVATDLRVSLTDRCNLRCQYCMPAEGLAWTPDERLLTDAEMIRLVRLAVERLGVSKVRFTGGEPLLRRGLEQIVAATAQLRTRAGQQVDIALTTNGLGLERRARALRDAGLTRINVSLDTLHRDRFTALTRRDRLHDVLAGLAAARDAGLTPVKVNAVLMRGINETEAPDLLAWALAEGYRLRFIEQMPLDAQGAWDRDRLVTAAEILRSLGTRFELTPQPHARRGTAPAETFDVAAAGGLPSGTVGVIGSVTRPFCGDCDRTRLTADGQIRTCLFATRESDLRGLLRSGAGDEEIADAWRVAMWGKGPGHDIGAPEFRRPDRPMSAIGG